MSMIELTKTLIENIGGILASVAAFLVACKGIYEIVKSHKRKETQKQKDKIEKNNSLVLDQGFLINKHVRFINKKYNGNRVFLFSLHNSGNILTGTSQKKITILPYEDTSAITVKELYDFWQSRPVDFEMLRLMDHINKDEYIHFEDITSQVEDNIGLRSIINASQGKEIYLIKIGWFEKDKLVCLLIQRDINFNTVPLNPRQKGDINYTASEIKQLLKETDFRI